MPCEAMARKQVCQKTLDSQMIVTALNQELS